MSIFVPPLKCQGIKTKLVKWISGKVPDDFNIWYEPFMGSGVVGFNINPRKAIFGDTNPYIIQFYNDIKNATITSEIARSFLTQESAKLLTGKDDYYRTVRERFNRFHSSLDFLFLNRSCFNGMIRFNSKGDFNVPFCKKPHRFTKAYISKICNQISGLSNLMKDKEWYFVCDTFSQIIKKASPNDIIYCDPPYIDRYADYFNAWTAIDEKSLFSALMVTDAKFILSSWHHNKYRENTYIHSLWSQFNVDTKEHFYHLGAQEHHRNAIIEALITNF